MKRLLLLLGGMLLLALPLGAQPAFRKGEKAPDFTVELLDGSRAKFAKYRGRVVLLSFWATWCKPCLKELNEVPEKILARFEGRDFAMLAVAKGEPRETVERKMRELQERGIAFPVCLDPYEKISTLLGDERIPQLIIVDPKGVVRYHEIGYTPERLDEAAETIEKLLNE